MEIWCLVDYYDEFNEYKILDDKSVDKMLLFPEKNSVFVVKYKYSDGRKFSKYFRTTSEKMNGMFKGYLIKKESD